MCFQVLVFPCRSLIKLSSQRGKTGFLLLKPTGPLTNFLDIYYQLLQQSKFKVLNELLHRFSVFTKQCPQRQEANKTRMDSGYHKYKTKPVILVWLFSVNNPTKLG